MSDGATRVALAKGIAVLYFVFQTEEDTPKVAGDDGMYDEGDVGRGRGKRKISYEVSSSSGRPRGP